MMRGARQHVSKCSSPFVLCADDYAINEGVSRAILDLIDAGRLTAVSAMASTPLWRQAGKDLIARRGCVAVGLHLDLTHCPFEGKRPPFDLRRLLIESLIGRLDVATIALEFERQFDRFEVTFGFAPDHVDGHHHVHALPQVRIAFFQVLRRRFSGQPALARPLVRDPADTWRRILSRGGARAKALTVDTLSKGFQARARAYGFETNIGFSGFSHFAGDGQYRREFIEFLREPGPRHLVMCHPGGAANARAALERTARAGADEYSSLMANALLPSTILRICRDAGRSSSAFADWAPGTAFA